MSIRVTGLRTFAVRGKGLALKDSIGEEKKYQTFHEFC